MSIAAQRDAMDHRESILLTDLYQLNMMQSYYEHGMTGPAVFEFFVRKLPPERGFLMAAGLAQALDFLETLRCSEEDLSYLDSTGRFSAAFLERLASLRFTGDVEAMPEGTLFFPDEPILRVTAPLPEAQLVETRLVNLLHFQTVVASKAARMRLAARDKSLVDFGLRRAHGAEAGLLAARAAYIAGFDATATVAAGALFGIPITGTMAHSYIQAHADEIAAFRSFARSRPDNLTLLIDTYDTEEAARRLVPLAHQLQAEGIAITGVRIDSGDLGAHAEAVRHILDEGGVPSIRIFASGGIDERLLLRLEHERAPIDGYGIGTSLTTASDCPALDCAYKLQEYEGIARRKRSEGKATWPGRKQVWRRHLADGSLAGDTISIESDALAGEKLIVPVMRGGRRLAQPSLAETRAHAAGALRCLPLPLKRLAHFDYGVTIGRELHRLADICDRHQQHVRTHA